MFEFLSSHGSLLVGFAFTSLIIELTPGPNMAYLAILTSRYGKRAGYFAIAGIATGLILIGIVAAFGLAALIQESPWLYVSMRWCGVAYLFWLAWEAWRDADTSNATEIPTLNHNKFFIRGMITNLLNPKAGLFYLAVLPRFVERDHLIAVQMIVLTLIYVCVASAIHFSIVVLANFTNRFLDSAVHRIYFSRSMSLLLGCVAIWFAWSTRLQ